ncbi:MAG: D-alanyl-D-alanine carboxypeptidase family protein [Ethanoligenens sp.]|uniref:D-alanyl-D-alanine carboxypeptidase family protein n=1 Tax=Ethanoligenens sp. TaxID=2099655 RepID=UPI0039E7E564
MRKTIVTVVLFLTVAIGISGLHVLAWDPPAAVSSNTVYLVNSDTGTVIYEKNADQKVYPASITKLTTALLTIQKYGNALDTVITVQKDDLSPLSGTGSSVLGLKVGEQITVRQLLYGLLVKSGNDCAMVLARAVGGSVSAFVDMMNEEAKKLGADHTHYVNPEGLQDPNHYTTAKDVYLIAKQVMANDFLASVVDTPSYTIPATNVTPALRISNTNLLISSGSKYFLDSVKGIKTGTTSEAGACLVSLAQKKGVTYYAVVMGGQETIANNDVTNTAFADTKALYQWALGSFQTRELLNTGTPQAQVPLLFAWKQQNLRLVPKEQFNALIPTAQSKAAVTVTPINPPKSVPSPVKKGQYICSADVLLGGQKIGTIQLVAAQNVQRSTPLYVFYLISKFFHSPWFKLVCIGLVILLVLYFILTYRHNHRKKAGMRRRKRSKRYPR